MQKVEGSSPFSRFEERPAATAFPCLPARSTDAGLGGISVGRFRAKQLRRDRDVSLRDRPTEVRSGPRRRGHATPECDHRPMSDADPERNSFEDVARALADEVSRAIERLSEIDLDEIARAASAEGERARRWIDDLGRWLREQGDAISTRRSGLARRGTRAGACRSLDARSPDRRGSAATRRTASARSPHRRPRTGAGGTRLGPLEGRAGNERARRPRRGPRAQRRARARPRAARSRLDDRRRSRSRWPAATR